MKRDLAKLRRWMVRRRKEGRRVGDICSQARVPRSTFYTWWDKYEKEGLEGLKPKSRRPKTIHRTPDSVKERIIAIREETGHNEKTIQVLLEKEGICVGHATVYRTLKDAGLIKRLKKKRRQKTYKSWSRKHPNSLWQTDLCIYKRRWLSTFIDDCSRYILGIELFKRRTTENILGQLETIIDEYGKPRQIITDHGTQYYASKGQVSCFTVFCKDQGIQHIFGGIGKPTTLGKIERFHRTFRATYPRFNSLETFVDYYNNERPHAGIGYKIPSQVFSKVSNMS